MSRYCRGDVGRHKPCFWRPFCVHRDEVVYVGLENIAGEVHGNPSGVFVCDIIPRICARLDGFISENSGTACLIGQRFRCVVKLFHPESAQTPCSPEIPHVPEVVVSFLRVKSGIDPEPEDRTESCQIRIRLYKLQLIGDRTVFPDEYGLCLGVVLDCRTCLVR